MLPKTDTVTLSPKAPAPGEVTQSILLLELLALTLQGNVFRQGGLELLLWFLPLLLLLLRVMGQGAKVTTRY